MLLNISKVSLNSNFVVLVNFTLSRRRNLFLYILLRVANLIIFIVSVIILTICVVLFIFKIHIESINESFFILLILNASIETCVHIKLINALVLKII